MVKLPLMEHNVDVTGDFVKDNPRALLWNGPRITDMLSLS